MSAPGLASSPIRTICAKVARTIKGGFPLFCAAAQPARVFPLHTICDAEKYISDGYTIFKFLYMRYGKILATFAANLKYMGLLYYFHREGF